MQQLTGLDAVFLNLETNAAPMHVGALTIVDPSTAPGDFGFEPVRDMIESRLHLLPMFRRRLLTTPLNLDQPYWLEDPDFDIENHVRHRSLPRPGTDKQLCRVVSEIFATRLDRSRPLWEFHYIDGLSGGRVACLSKVHHACVDGLSGAELLSRLLDVSPVPASVPAADTPWVPDELPPPWKLSYVTLRHLLARPGDVYRLVKETAPIVFAMGNTALARRRASAATTVERTGGLAPRIRFNTTITARRSYAFRALSLADVKLIKNAFGVSVNDVVLTICAEALRNYLLEKKELPDKSLIAAIPMSVRAENEKGTHGNKVTMARTQLCTDIADPVERLQAIGRKMGAVKKTMKAIPAHLMLDWAHAPPPAVMAQAARLYENFSIQDFMSPPYNLVISNVPGPPVPLYLCGAQVLGNYPVSIPYHGLACNITVFSYRDNLDVGITAHRGTVPDPDHLALLMATALQTLKARARAPKRKTKHPRQESQPA